MQEDFYYASETELDREDARQRGSFAPEQAWVSTDRDVWHPNPYYTGEPVPHPEDDGFWEAASEHPEGYEGALRDYRSYLATRASAPPPPLEDLDDEIPF